LKNGVLDPQGQSDRSCAQQSGFDAVGEVRQGGKVIDIRACRQGRSRALRAKPEGTCAKKWLANTVIEQ